jgi:hypothetical protein
VILPLSRDSGVARTTHCRALQSNDEPLLFEGSRLESLQRATALNPELNIQVDRRLIGDHNDIWEPEIIAFLRDLIAISTTPITAEK